MFLSDIKDNGQKHVFLSVLNLIITDGIDFQAFLLIIFFRSNGKSLQQQKTAEKRNKKNKKARRKFPQPLPTFSCGCVFVVKGWLGGMVKWKGRSVG